MLIQYPRIFPYPGIFTYPGNIPNPGFLQEFLHNLIPGLPYPQKFPYPVIASVRKSAYLLESNNNWKQESSGLNDTCYIPSSFLTQSHPIIYTSLFSLYFPYTVSYRIY